MQGRKTTGLIIALSSLTLLLAVAVLVVLNSTTTKLDTGIESIQKTTVGLALSDTLNRETIAYEFDPDNPGSFAKYFEKLHLDTRNWFVNEGLQQIKLAEAESWSRQLWVRALETMYSTVLSTTMKNEARTRELVGEMVDVTFYNYRPSRTNTVNLVLKEFGYTESDTTRVADAFSESDSTGSPAIFVRPFEYSIFAEILPSQLAGPIYGYLKEDMSRLQIIYEDVLRRRPWLQDEAPERFEAALVQFLEKVLREGKGIDFDAELSLNDYGNLRFVERDYESWSGLRKVLFSMGPKGAKKVRVIARGLLDRLEPPETE